MSSKINLSTGFDGVNTVLVEWAEDLEMGVVDLQMAVVEEVMDYRTFCCASAKPSAKT